MTKAIIVVPWLNGSAQFPGIDSAQVSWVCASYVPPLAGTPAYALVEISATQAIIDILTARSDCLFICSLDENGFDKTATTATQRNAVVTKIQAMGFTGAQFGLLNAAIQSSRNRSDLAVAIATKAFYRNTKKDFMTDRDLYGAAVGG